MYKVIIEDLYVDTIIGLCDWERDVEQRISFDIEIQVDIRNAAEMDDINKTVDYVAISDQVKKFTRSNKFFLIETLVVRLMRHLIDTYVLIDSLTITVRKPLAIKNASSATVKGSMSRSDMN
jgi:dihydroneopterin aldolase